MNDSIVDIILSIITFWQFWVATAVLVVVYLIAVYVSKYTGMGPKLNMPKVNLPEAAEKAPPPPSEDEDDEPRERR